MFGAPRVRAVGQFSFCFVGFCFGFVSLFVLFWICFRFGLLDLDLGFCWAFFLFASLLVCFLYIEKTVRWQRYGSSGFKFFRWETRWS